ncbi:MAG: CpsD/CapB family tyrosine-protein kinase [Clostridiales bacterium]|nr:CpsD/CapB family tyrosine-protein kinase [Clostridiales bacterium]
MAKKSANSGASRVLLKNTDLDAGIKFRVEEAYKSIRTNIMLSVMKKGGKIIVIFSSNPGEGKTTITANLAISMAQADQRVLLIDGDLRKPKIHHYFSLPNAPGLTNFLGSAVNSRENQKVDLFSVIHKTDFPNLYVLPSGSIPPNPAEILGSEPMAELLEEAAENYDYIIIDTPPLNVVSDALPIIRKSDGVVLVVRSYSSTHPEIQKSLNSLSFINAKILGFVVNYDSEKSSGYGKYRNNYGYYEYTY